MILDDQKIKDILVKENYITSEDAKKADEFAKARRASIVDYLFSEKLITKDLLGQAIAESFGIQYADLNSNPPAREQVFEINEETAKKLRIIIFKKEGRVVTIATDNPAQPELVDELKKLFSGKAEKIIIAYSLPEDIEAILSYYRKTLETRFAGIIKQQKKIAPEIIGEIFEDAFIYRASDIHFEPEEKEIIIRFRIDGVLHEAGRLPKEYYENIINRVKVQSLMRIDEHFAAQDGAIRYEKDGNFIDMRVSIAPTIDGEKIAIRVLSEYVRNFTLDDIGLTPHHRQFVEEAAKKPFGMILVVGPTGSGKTTTLYSLLKVINQPDVNITTIEDPVEYKISNINQIQVNLQTNLTFAKGLRSIIRQDPDIILVGEIRDSETAEISVNAALTGHLLFSTLHANDAATSIPRLLDMGIEPFLLSSTLEAIIAQRLVRKICENCRYSRSINQAELEKLSPALKKYFPAEFNVFYEGKGCNLCSHTGYKGRTAIFEFIRVNSELKDLILKKPTSKQIWQLAASQGARLLFDDGLEKVKNGITTISELMRVVSIPE